MIMPCEGAACWLGDTDAAEAGGGEEASEDGGGGNRWKSLFMRRFPLGVRLLNAGLTGGP